VEQYLNVAVEVATSVQIIIKHSLTIANVKKKAK
jgi:hypothetical protein